MGLTPRLFSQDLSPDRKIVFGFPMCSTQYVLLQAQSYIERIPKSIELQRAEVVLDLIRSTGSISQQRDYLMAFILASLLRGTVKRFVFEEPCTKHLSRGEHDLVAYLNDGSRIVNEIRRLGQTPWDRNEEDNYVLGAVANTGQLYQLREDPNRSTTSFFDTMLKVVESKSNQFDPNATNILWLTSKGIHFRETDIEDAASHYASGWSKLPDSQPGKSHSKPMHLSALGWFWDGDPKQTTMKAECFFIPPFNHICDLGDAVTVRKMKP